MIYGDPIIIYPKPFSIYSRRTILYGRDMHILCKLAGCRSVGLTIAFARADRLPSDSQVERSLGFGVGTPTFIAIYDPSIVII